LTWKDANELDWLHKFYTYQKIRTLFLRLRIF